MYRRLEQINSLLGSSWSQLIFCPIKIAILGIETNRDFRGLKSEFSGLGTRLRRRPPAGQIFQNDRTRLRRRPPPGQFFQKRHRVFQTTCLCCCCPVFCLPEVPRPQNVLLENPPPDLRDTSGVSLMPCRSASCHSVMLV